MNFIRLFDVIGPEMVGPSSSHTAGAASMALLSGKLFAHPVRRATFTLYGSFAETYRGHGTDKALLGGVLGFTPDDSRIRDSFAIATEQGVEFRFVVDAQSQMDHPNTVDIFLEGYDDTVQTTRGVSLGGGRIKIVGIDNIAVDFTGEYSTLIFYQQDTPGVAAYITQCLGQAGINIAFMRIFREEKGETAFTVVESDDKISDEVRRRLEENENIHKVVLIQL